MPPLPYQPIAIPGTSCEIACNSRPLGPVSKLTGLPTKGLAPSSPCQLRNRCTRLPIGGTNIPSLALPCNAMG
jgi:hypothetical protein